MQMQAPLQMAMPRMGGESSVIRPVVPDPSVARGEGRDFVRVLPPDLFDQVQRGDKNSSRRRECVQRTNYIVEIVGDSLIVSLNLPKHSLVPSAVQLAISLRRPFQTSESARCPL
jgi:hypothetical protein